MNYCHSDDELLLLESALICSNSVSGRTDGQLTKVHFPKLAGIHLFMNDSLFRCTAIHLVTFKAVPLINWGF